MNRSTKVRFAAFAASLLVTFSVVAAFSEYEYAPPADSAVVVASTLH